MKRFACGAIWLLVASCAFAFPSEEQVHASMRRGLTVNEVLARFGDPSTGRVQPCVDCTMSYLPPFENLTADRVGIIGFRIQFANGVVSQWEVLHGKPSYARPEAPRFFWPYLKLLGILAIIGVVSRMLIRATPAALVVADEVVRAFEDREIQTAKLPAEFRFITHEHTLQEVLDKAGAPSRTVRIPISAESGLGYAFAASGTGKPEIVAREYALPYHAAVIVMPEFPFEPQNRIRAVFYRPVQRELAEAVE